MGAIRSCDQDKRYKSLAKDYAQLSKDYAKLVKAYGVGVSLIASEAKETITLVGMLNNGKTDADITAWGQQHFRTLNLIDSLQAIQP